MDSRREDRFSIYGTIKATPLSRPDHQMDCVLLDISATGLKLIAPESLPVDDIISIEAEDHLALADVRYSQVRGDKFTIGCERIHVLNKVALPNDPKRVEQIRLLVEDYRNCLRTGIATPRPNADAAEAARLERELLAPAGDAERVAAAAPEKVPEKAPEIIPEKAPELALEKAPEKVSAADAPAEKPLPGPGSFSTHEQLLVAAAGWVGENWDKIAASPKDGQAARSDIVDRLTFHLAARLHAPVAAQSPPRAEVPAAKIPEKVAQKVAEKAQQNPPPKAKSRRWRFPAGVAVAAVLGWGLSALFWSLGSSGAASHLPASLAALISPNPPAPPAPATLVRHVQIKVVEPTWMIATCDGKRLFNKKLAKNEVREIEFSDKALLHVGNAKGVEIRLDGKPIGPIGGRGQTRNVELSANGFRLLPLN